MKFPTNSVILGVNACPIYTYSTILTQLLANETIDKHSVPDKRGNSGQNPDKVGYLTPGWGVTPYLYGEAPDWRYIKG